MYSSVRSQAGDTIIEVMLAISVLTFILVFAWGITNRATQTLMNAQLRVDVVDQMKEQAEILKAKYASAEQGNLSDLAPGGYTSPLGEVIGDRVNPCHEVDFSEENILQGGGRYHFTTAGAVENAKQINEQTAYVWVERYAGDTVEGTVAYYDFYIRACWQTLGGIQNQDNSQFIVRLNNDN